MISKEKIVEIIQNETWVEVDSARVYGIEDAAEKILQAAQQGVQADACYCCRDGGCQEGCRCWQLLPEESRR